MAVKVKMFFQTELSYCPIGLNESRDPPIPRYGLTVRNPRLKYWNF